MRHTALLGPAAACVLASCARSPAPRASDAGPHTLSDRHLALAHDALDAKRRRLDERGPKSFDQPGEAREFFLAQRVAPGQDYPARHVHDVLAQVRARESELGPRDLPGGISSWQSIGPGNVGGRTRAIVFNPQDPDIVYAAGVDGGVWKSINGGEHWFPTDDFMANLAVCALAIDPTNPDVIYAGTGEGYYASPFGLTHPVFARGLGIFKSVDAGATWTHLQGTISDVPEGAFSYVNKIVISPTDPSRIYAATRFGVWRSLDAGETWSAVLRNPRYMQGQPASLGCITGCTDLAIRSDRDPDVLFATFGVFERDGLFRSNDGGTTWVRYNTGANQGRMTLAFAPSDNDVLYLLMADNGQGNPTGKLVQVYRSTDGGNSFQARVNMNSLTGPWLLSNLILATGCQPGGTYSQGWYDNIIAVDPVDPDVVWVGGVDMFRSDDGAQNFGIAAYWIFYRDLFNPRPYQLHPDHHVIVFHPHYDGGENQTMLVGCDGGIFRTRNARAATSIEDCPLPGDDPFPEIVWERMNNGYAVTQYYHGTASKLDDKFLGGAQDNGTSLGQSRDDPDGWSMVFGGDGGYTAISSADSNVMYVEYQFFPTIQKSVNDGLTFSPAFDGITDTDGLFVTPIAMDHEDPNVLWTGGRRPWRTTNGAALWQAAGPDIPGGDRISAIGIAPTNGNVVYLGFNNGYVARSTNALSASPTWSLVSAGLPIGAWVSSVTVDPEDPNTAYATSSTFGVNHIHRTNNGGASWYSIDGIASDGVPDIAVHWLAVRPCDSDQLYAATELGVFASDDAGETWRPANTGLAHTVVESLDFQDQNTLVAFTYGRSAFIADLDPCCPADIDGDGDADGDDFFAYLDLFANGDGRADLDQDGDRDADDFFLYLDLFAQGC
ncbi:MAG: hypothetical protein H6811_08735 [Phycisphaeraceae bacterium]|nr:hypothetical protein [Phycisphaeraceae bacterium]